MFQGYVGKFLEYVNRLAQEVSARSGMPSTSSRGGEALSVDWVFAPARLP